MHTLLTLLLAISGPPACVLTPADFARVGILGAAAPTVNVQDGGQSSYCSYTRKSGAMGGVELDVFDPAGTSPADVQATFTTTLGDLQGRVTPATVRGADEARMGLAVTSGGGPFAAISVRRGNLVFSLSIPSGPRAASQLTELSELVLRRVHH